MLRRLARWCYRRRRITLLLWLIGVVALSVAANRIGDDYREGFKIVGTESSEAQDLLVETFPERAGDTGQLVVHARGGLLTAGGNQPRPEIQRVFDDTLAEIEGVDLVTSTTSPFSPEGAAQGLVSADGQTAYADIQLRKRAVEIPERVAQEVLDIVERARADAPPGVQVEVGGRMFQIPEFGGTSEGIGLLAAVFVLLVAFGSVLAMGLPIGTALFGIGAGFAVIALLSNVSTMPDFTTQLGAMLGLGVGIDYALFIVTRYRQGLHDGLEPEAATVLALDTAGRAVLFAGATVVVSLFGLFLMGVEFIRGLGAGAAATVLITMLASATLVPALLGFVGHGIDRFSIPKLHRRENQTRESVWFRWSRFVQRRPLIAALAGLAVLLVIALPFFGMRLGFSDAGNAPREDTTRRAYDLVSEGFGPGTNGPLVLAARTPEGPESLGDLRTALDDVRGIASASPVFPGPEGEVSVIVVIPTTSPQSEQTKALIERLRDDVIPTETRGTDARVYVGGITAGGVDVSEYLGNRIPIFMGAVLGLSFLLLLSVFRSLLVPVKAVIVNLLSITAAFGVMVAVFQWGWLAGPLGLDRTGPIEPFIPMMLFAVVFGLSMDYEVFLLSRIREEYDRTGDNALAVADGLAATARVITAAAAIMVVVFASFALGDDRILKVFGISFAVAILLDATIVRVVLVPATMELLGDRNWWLPRWLTWIPRLHVEPEVPPEQPQPASPPRPVPAGPA